MNENVSGVDPRPLFEKALDQAQRQVVAVVPADRTRPTPCGEYDVQTLLGHLVAVLRKLETVMRGGDATLIEDPADDPVEVLAAMFSDARVRTTAAWACETALDRSCTLPWGTMSGREVIEAYTHEFTAHSWDLAISIGRDDLDPVLAEAAYDWFSRNVPAEDRGPGGGFGPAVPVPDESDPYIRLAGFLGRSSSDLD